MATENQESRRKELNDINRELMLANGVYNDLVKQLSKISLRIFKFKKRIDNLLDGEK